MIHYFDLFPGCIVYYPMADRLITLSMVNKYVCKAEGSEDVIPLDSIQPVKISKQTIEMIDPASYNNMSTIMDRFEWTDSNQIFLRDKDSSVKRPYQYIHQIQMIFIADYGKLLRLKSNQ